ncbi:MAG: Fic family protein [Methanomassiliicoccales archaeon]|nr:MAG: Fic family protein [Methanomassiliicoccales archaeon]
MEYRTNMRESILLELRQSLLTRTPLPALPESVWKRIGALNTWGTNAIEGNTLTWRDVERVLLEQRSVGNRPISDVLETLQHEAAFRGLTQQLEAPIRLQIVLKLHETVFRGIYPDAGHWRRVNVRITGSTHTPPRAEKVVTAMASWEEEYTERDLKGEPTFGLASWMHHRFEAIHPFTDGNGRIGRLLLNLHFLKHSWPPVHVLPPDRSRYVHALESGHSGDLSELEAFLKIAAARSLLDLLDQVGTQEDELKPFGTLKVRGDHSTNYLGLRASQGELPAIKMSGKWHSSERGVRLYAQFVGRRGLQLKSS